MIARGGGGIVIVSSVGAMQGSRILGAYNISKAADLQLARNLAVELGKHRIRVNCVARFHHRADDRCRWRPDDRRIELLS